MSRVPLKAAAPVVGIGLAAGTLSGLLGVGGGIIMVPLLVALVHLSQHQAHATSLAAIVPIGAVGALTFALDGEIDFKVAGLLALGALAGAPVGARIMSRIKERPLKIMFGVLMTVVGIQMLVV
ncbi:MAG TPA: sulfite exporter TauE/SafE family protein [Actinomycetota bacterium]|nr:sulfite exporter TauE/SafE family protein [Actinomycetota bacterium]